MRCSTTSTKGFLGGSMKAYQAPSNIFLCVLMFMFSNTAPLSPHCAHTHTSMYTNSFMLHFVSRFISPRLKKSSRSAEIYTYTHMRKHSGRHADEVDTPSVKLQAQIDTSFCDRGISLLIVAGRNPPSSLS